MCESPVGRSRNGKAGRASGFCPDCGAGFDFTPRLNPGDILNDQYEVVGCLAHGGLGWIYLAKDTGFNDLWVVLKGLLNAADEAAARVAVAEKRFLAELDHPNIVRAYTFITHKGAGYIVMEYVGGPSLNQILKQRRKANGGRADPLPVDQAISYILAALPAFAYLHDRNLVYCDFKPDNLIQVHDQVKLIDLGAVRRLGDPSGDVYGTAGIQAPEIAELGPSVASDLYTIGRTLAVLTLEFRYQKQFRYSIPPPADQPLLTRFDSFHRFLLKATARHPDDRFQTVGELDEQLLGVLREVVALSTGQPQPSPSGVFGPVPDDQTVAPLAVDPSDPAAAFLANLAGQSPGAVLRAIHDALESAQVADTVELSLHRAQALIDAGDHRAANEQLDTVEARDPWEWRTDWLRGTSALAAGNITDAAIAFDHCRSELPGELAPKLAAARASEEAGDLVTAAALYEIVVRVDPAYVAAARGLARCREKAGDLPGALAAYDRVPRSHRAFLAAQVDAVGILVACDRYDEAASRLDQLDADGSLADEFLRAKLDVELLNAVLRALRSGKISSSSATTLRGCRLDERSVRFGLEDALRRLGRLTPDRAERCRVVDRANDLRPVTLR